jgi:tetratricopeptide (TPR) repeat protein
MRGMARVRSSVASPTATPARSAPAWPWLLLALFIAAWAWRFFYLRRLAHSQLAGSLNADSLCYWEWSAFLLRVGPMGRNPFYMGPLYPYVLALLRLVFKDAMGSVLLVQATWGAAATVLIADAARRLTRPAAGLAIGMLVAGYQMAVFFDGLVLMESLLFFIESLLLWVVVRESWTAPRRAALAGAGVLIGLLAQGRATASALLIPLALLIFQGASGARDAARRVALVLAVYAAVCAPAAIRNYAVSGEWIPFTYNLGFNLFVGNNPEAIGSYVGVAAGDYAPIQHHDPNQDGGMDGDGRSYLRAVTGIAFGPTASSRFWAERATTWARTHPIETLRLAAFKLAMMWNRREYSQIEDIDEFRVVLGPIGLPFVGRFAFLGALALAGLVFAWRAGGRARFAIGYLAVMTLAIAPFFVTDRYRVHLVPAAALLAAFAIAEALRLIRTRTRAATITLGAGLAVGIAVVNLPLPSLDTARPAWDMACDLGDRWLTRSRPDLAIPEYEKAIDIERAVRLRGSQTPAGKQAHAELYLHYGTAQLLLGRVDASVESYARAEQLAPGAAPVAAALMEADAAAGRFDRARDLCARIGMPASEAALGLIRKASVSASVNQLPAAERLLLGAMALDSTQTMARRALIRLYVQTRRFDEARAALRRARAAGYGGGGAYAYEALIAAAQGDVKRARRALDRVEPAALAADPALGEIVEYVRGVIQLAGGGAR